ncbi:fibrinogen-like protein 1-like protein [Pleurodeles waltl]|uniref:fibrinogen-like protein 1-like protein n=1 Tax=Pleurodeles waltl TaxID=8319 RepID=UPI003709A3F4
MRLVPALLLGPLGLLMVATVAAALTEVSEEELVPLIGNRHVIMDKKATPLLNIPRGKMILEYFPKDCRDAYLRGQRSSGLYVIKPKFGPPLIVYCDLLTDGGGWTVLLRNNRDEQLQWSQPWDFYKFGFGNPTGNHRLGNEFIYLLTRQNGFSVRFSIVDSKGQTRNADYHSFRVDSERNGYALRLGDYSGNAGDALTVMNETGVHDNMKFTTNDLDNDRWKRNCAEENEGGWWYDSCQSALLSSDLGIYWSGLCDRSNPCRSATIMIQPNKKNCEADNNPNVGVPPVHLPKMQ